MMATDNSPIEYRCSACKDPLSSTARFCPSCGRRVLDKSSNPKPTVLWSSLAVTLLVVSGIFVLEPKLLGTKPTQEFKKEAVEDSSAPPEERASKALDKLNSEENPDPQVVLEAVDALGAILEKDPENKWALVNMAELSFARQVFDKSAEMYSRYLKLAPDDDSVRCRYANALSFSGKPDEALKELDKVLAHDKNNFQALAFSAIIYSQKGDIAKAKEVAKAAMPKAPNEEARERLNKFLEAISNSPGKPIHPAIPQGDNKPGTEEENEKPSIEKFQSWVQSHPILGPKFSKIESAGDEIRLFLKEFPMDQMPPFARDKFIASIKQNAAGLGKSVSIRDADSGKELISIPLNS